MKKIILILGVIAAFSYQSKAQKTYLPVFGSDSTVFYYHLYHSDFKTFHKVVYVRDENKQNMYYSTLSSLLGGALNDSIKISSDNSKMWYKYGAEDRMVLVMDLNLNIGDEFLSYNYYCENRPFRYVVKDVFIKDNRKHIVFEGGETYVGMCVVCDGSDEIFVEDFALTFIEGVGPNIQFGYCTRNPAGSSEWVPILCSQKKDDKHDYGVPAFYPFWGLDGITTRIDEKKISELKAFPVPVDKSLELSLPEMIDINTAEVTVKNISGMLLLKQTIIKNPTVIDFSQLPSGVYLIEVSATNYQKVLKIIKKEQL